MRNSYRDTKPGGSRGGRKSAGGNFWEQRGSASSGPSRVMMHKAICEACGKQCEVPFKPNGSKPVFCSMCFQRDEGTDYKRSNGGGSGRSTMGEKRSYGSESKYEDRKTDNVSEQFRIVNAKLDAILKALS